MASQRLPADSGSMDHPTEVEHVRCVFVLLFASKSWETNMFCRDCVEIPQLFGRPSNRPSSRLVGLAQRAAFALSALVARRSPPSSMASCSGPSGEAEDGKEGIGWEDGRMSKFLADAVKKGHGVYNTSITRRGGKDH